MAYRAFLSARYTERCGAEGKRMEARKDNGERNDEKHTCSPVSSPWWPLFFFMRILADGRWIEACRDDDGRRSESRGYDIFRYIFRFTRRSFFLFCAGVVGQALIWAWFITWRYVDFRQRGGKGLVRARFIRYEYLNGCTHFFTGKYDVEKYYDETEDIFGECSSILFAYTSVAVKNPPCGQQFVRRGQSEQAFLVRKLGRSPSVD